MVWVNPPPKPAKFNGSVVHIDGKSGELYKHTHRPTREQIESGTLRCPILSLHNVLPNTAGVQHFATPSVQDAIHSAYTCFAFVQGAVGDVLYTVDERGYVYNVDMENGTYHLLTRSGISGSAVAARDQVLVAFSDSSLLCVHPERRNVTAKIVAGNHTLPVEHIAFHPVGHQVLTVSPNEAIIWLTASWERKRVLSSGVGTRIIQANFAKEGSLLLAAFEDGTLHIWQSDTFDLVWRIDVSHFASTEESGPLHALVSFTVSDDGALLAASTNDGVILLWDMKTKTLLSELSMPALKSSGIAKVQLMPHRQALVVLSTHGALFLFSVKENKLICRPKMKHPIKDFAVNQKGTLIALQLMDAPGRLVVWSMASLYQTQLSNDKSVTLADEELSSEPSTQTEKEKETVETQVKENRPPMPVKAKAPQPTSQNIFRLSQLLHTDDVLNRDTLGRFLQHYGQFPDRYRPMIWRCLLRLPENRHVFQKAFDQPLHAALTDFKEKFPIKYGKTSLILEKIMSAMMHWSDVFVTWDGLPAFCFPFVKTLQKEPMTCFELLLTFMRNWGVSWFEFFPNAPFGVLSFVDALLQKTCPVLYQHFRKAQIGSHIYGWLPLRTHFSDLLCHEDWLMMWDHAFTYRPYWLYCFLACFLKHHQLSLLSLHLPQDVKFFFTKTQPTLIREVLKESHQLYAAVAQDPHFTEATSPFQALDSDFYFVFNAYPEKINGFQKKMAQKLDTFEENQFPVRLTDRDVGQTIEELRATHLHDDVSGAIASRTHLLPQTDTHDGHLLIAPKSQRM